MSEAKEKDRILAQIKAFQPLENIENLSKYIDELETSKYVHTAKEEGGGIVAVRLTGEGHRFFKNGGYRALAKSERKSRISARGWTLIGAVEGSVLTELIHILAGWLTK